MAIHSFVATVYSNVIIMVMILAMLALTVMLKWYDDVDCAVDAPLCGCGASVRSRRQRAG